MNSGINFKDDNSKQEKSKVAFDNLKNKYILHIIFDYMKKNKSLKFMKYNKQLQNRLNLSIRDYKDYSELYSPIEIELKFAENEHYKYEKFINISDKDNDYYHIYFDNSNQEIKRTYFEEEENVSTIKIIIDSQIKSFKELFKDSKSISSISFKKFYRINITNMSGMFAYCSSLKELNLSNFNTNNVTDMSGLFNGCSSLKEINLSNFNTKNVTDMSYMFGGCESINELNLSNFNTNNVTDMRYMFFECRALKELNLSNFNTNNVTDMSHMFSSCYSLEKINLSNFNTINATDISSMFYKCLSLKELNLSSFNINNKIDLSYMFCQCSSLEELNFLGFNPDNIKYLKNIKYMFSDCSYGFINKIKSIYENIDDIAFE